MTAHATLISRRAIRLLMLLAVALPGVVSDGGLARKGAVVVPPKKKVSKGEPAWPGE